jgi:hypothetical protein
MIRVRGVEYERRGANKKYDFLDDFDWLYEQLKVKSIAQLAKECDVPANSIRHRVMCDLFPEEWRLNIRWERKPHKNKSKF